MKKILFPTEFSTHSPEVLKFAADIAFFNKAELVLFHAFGLPELPPDPSKSADQILEDISSEAVDKMMALVDNHLSKEYMGEIKVSYITKVGFAADTIIQKCKEDLIDLVVMGMTGITDKITFLGSTTFSILEKVDCPILIIPSKATFQGIDNLVYTTNFQFRDLMAVNYLKKWSKLFSAPLFAVHVLEKDEPEASVLKDINILRETYKGHKNLYFELIKGRFEEQIEGFAKSKKADIIAMLAHKRNFIDQIIQNSTTEVLAKRISIPLLVLKEETYEEKPNNSWLSKLKISHI